MIVFMMCRFIKKKHVESKEIDQMQETGRNRIWFALSIFSCIFGSFLSSVALKISSSDWFERND